MQTIKKNLSITKATQLVQNSHSWGQKSCSEKLMQEMLINKNNYDFKSYCIFENGDGRVFTLRKTELDAIQDLKKELYIKMKESQKIGKSRTSDYWTKEEARFVFSCDDKHISTKVEFLEK